MKGNFSGSFGAPWFKNSLIQDSILSNDYFNFSLLACWWCRIQVRSNRLHDRTLHRDFWIFPVLRYPISTWLYKYFKVDGFTIYKNFFLHEICSYRGFVRLQEFLIDVAKCYDSYAFNRDVFPTLLKMIITLSPPKW